MRCGFLLLVVIAIAGCPGGSSGLGEECGSTSDCDSSLQCSSSVCVPRCARAPECGDGYACSDDGICELASGQPGDACKSEVECAPGLSCQIDGTSVVDDHLIASCTAQREGKPSGGACLADGDCRNGTCALGQCVDLCRSTQDCAVGYSCTDIPRVEVNGALFTACLPAQGNVVWNIPISSPSSAILLPVPASAQYAQLVFSVADDAQRVGASRLVSPSNELLYQLPCNLSQICDDPGLYYRNTVRHQPELGQSVIAIPATPSAPLELGAYRVQVSSFRANGLPGSAVPHVTAMVRIDTATLLDLRFHFLGLEDHMCQSAMGTTTFDATAAQTAPFFQNDFLTELRGIFAHGGIALSNLSYSDVTNRPDLDALDVADVPKLVSMSTETSGIDVYFVRSLSPVGLQAFGPNTGPAGMAGTRQSGIVIGLDTLCYRSWKQLARLTAHELARYMGLQRNVEVDDQGMRWNDLLPDTDMNSDNLMFFSELGGTDITPDQRDILSRSGVLR